MEKNPYIPYFGLTGKRVLVTGAGRGIGLAAAHAMAHFGAEVVLAARTVSQIEEAAQEIRDNGGLASARALDVRDNDAVKRLFDELPAFHVLVNNAGINRTAPFLDVPSADFDDIMGLNVRSCFFVAQAAARRMVAENVRGSIINVSSQMGHVGASTRSVYCASKWAIEGLTKAAAIDLAPYGVRMNTLCPTFIETPLAQGFLKDPEFKADVLRRIKLGRVGQVNDVTGGLIFLASDASLLMTGSSIVIDGGWTAD